MRKTILEIDWLSPKQPIIVGVKDGETQDCLLVAHALAYPPSEGRTLLIRTVPTCPPT